VIATGFETEIGRIAQMLSADRDQRTPLQQRLAVFGRRLALIVLAICTLVFAMGVMRGGDPLLMFLTAVSLAVAAIPEALPAVVTVALALGAKKLSRANSLVRKLPAVETLGSVTFICADKTGTLTENRMAVDKVSVGGTLHARIEDVETSVRERLGQALALCNDVADAVDESKPKRAGGTEFALNRAADEAGFSRAALIAEFPKLAELPFNAERKRMTTFHRAGAGAIAFMKGAPERVLQCCTEQFAAAGRVEPIDLDRAKSAADALAGSGYRVLGIACREFGDAAAIADTASNEDSFTLIGFVALNDPIREEVPDAVRECVAAGVTPVMMTGDHPETARDIARRLGLLPEDGRVVTGPELAEIPDAELATQIKDIRVYARVNPEQKIRIVEALQNAGEFVAMTGDGVNDAPALKQASIGIAMGQRGTDVARESADIVLLDDNFSTIVAAIREGRHVYDNIRKFVRYTMSSNLGEILVLIVLPFVGYPVPLLPIHILWVNLVTDGLPGLAFSAEPAESGVMQRPPRSPTESIFGGGMWQQMVIAGSAIGLLASLSALFVASTELSSLHTMVFTTVVVSQLLHSISVRTERDSLLVAGLLSNPYLLAAIAIGLAAQLAIVYVPLLNDWFSTAPLSLSELGACLSLSVFVFVVAELQKALVARRVARRQSASGPR
jgi:Ca2+-transporting ATPase